MKGFIAYPKIIYGLQHPSTDEIVYVGSTQDLFKRLMSHINNPSPELKDWIGELRSKMLGPIIIELDRTTEHGNDAEMFWVQLLQTWGFNLKNHLLKISAYKSVKPGPKRIRNSNVRVANSLLDKWKGRRSRGDVSLIALKFNCNPCEISRVFTTGIGNVNVVDGMTQFYKEVEEDLIKELKKIA